MNTKFHIQFLTETKIRENLNITIYSNISVRLRNILINSDYFLIFKCQTITKLLVFQKKNLLILIKLNTETFKQIYLNSTNT